MVVVIVSFQLFPFQEYMPLSDKLQVKKLILAIKQATSSLKFSVVLAKLQQQHIFKFPTNPFIHLTHSQPLNQFTSNCYMYILLKLISHEKQNALESSIKVLTCCITEVATNIKQKYCQIMEEIKERKSQIIQLILFIVFFSLQTAFDLLCHHQLICYYCQPLLEKQKDLQSKACVWINYLITGVEIRPTVYRYLVKKYYDNLRTKKKVHRKSESVPNINILKSIQSPFEHQNQKSSFDTSKGQNVKKLVELDNELKLIFRQDKNNKKNRNNSKKRSENFQKQERSSFSQQHRNIPKIFAQASLRNSNAFNENRRDISQLKNIRQVSCDRTDRFKKRRQKMLALTRESKQKKNMQLNLMTATFKFLFGKEPKKNNQNPQKKTTLEYWSKKVQKMQNQGNIERVSLASSTKRLRKTICSGTDFEEEKMIQFLKNNYHACNTFRSIKMLELQRRKQPKKGFCEFIDNREPKQIGIVKSIVNFTNNEAEPKNIKLSSKGFKDQFEDFNKKMMGHAEYFFEDDNFTYRLQKVLTGTNKI